jgi:hypothetical protein
MIMIVPYNMYSDTHIGITAPPRLMDTNVSQTGVDEQGTHTSKSEVSFRDTWTISRRIRYNGIFTKLPNTIKRTMASAEIQENPSLVKAAPIIPKIIKGMKIMASPIRSTIMRIEIGPAEKKRTPPLMTIPHTPGFVQIIAA